MCLASHYKKLSHCGLAPQSPEFGEMVMFEAGDCGREKAAKPAMTALFEVG